MGLLDRIAQVFSRTPTPPTSSDEMRAAPLPRATASSDYDELVGLFRAESDRASVVNACREMYRMDTRAKRMIHTLARDMSKGGFIISVKNNPRAEQEANALIDRLKLSSRLDDWSRLTIRDGDTFLELGVDAALNIAKVTRKPTLHMHRYSNAADDFDDPTRAFWYSKEVYAGVRPGEDSLWFAEWQVIHARWEHDEGSKYGTPLFAAGSSSWKMVREGEIDIAVRRKTRSGMKYSHVLEGASEPELERYKELNKEALDNPLAAVTDFFSNRAGALTAIQGDAHLSEIGDVAHHIATWLIAGIVPKELIGYGENLNRDVLEQKKDEYDQELEATTQWLEDAMVKPLLDRQWLLKSILPESLDYEIKWRSKQALTARVIRDAADAVLRLKAAGFQDAVLVAVLEKFLPGIDLGLLGLEGDTLPPTSGTSPNNGAARVAKVADAMKL